MPVRVSETPQILTLESLISAKLSTYIGVGIRRVQDYADVVQLIQANRLKRDFGVDPGVGSEYRKIWDELRDPKTSR